MDDWDTKKGFPRRKEDLHLSVKGFLDKISRNNPLKNNLPSDGWYKAFLQRLPILSILTPEAVMAARSKISEKDIKDWVDNIKSYRISKDYFSILSDPRRVLNGDETCFNLCPKNMKVLAPKCLRKLKFFMSIISRVIYPHLKKNEIYFPVFGWALYSSNL